jgi:hypothetical protein
VGLASKLERRFTYAVYGILILWAMFTMARAAAWQLKVEDGRAVSPKECKACLADFASCMDLVDKEFSQETDVEPMAYVNQKLRCVVIAEQCGNANKCKTRIVRDEK